MSVIIIKYPPFYSHGRKTLDVTLSVRYANLPNNAKLELVKSEKAREESEVLIALQLESGERLQHSFSPGVTLWEVLLHWENVPDRWVLVPQKCCGFAFRVTHRHNVIRAVSVKSIWEGGRHFLWGITYDFKIFTHIVEGHYVPHRRGGGHIVFGADPVGIGVSVSQHDTFLFARYLMNQWVDFN